MNLRRAGPLALVILATGLAIGLVPAAGQGGAAPSWRGSYRYAFDGGRTAGGSPIRVAYTLSVVPGAARGGCLLTAEGFQSDERIVCHASGNAEALTVTFHGYADGRTVNRYGVTPYKLGETLLTLTRGEGGKPLTAWGAFRPDLPKDSASPGLYFERAE